MTGIPPGRILCRNLAFWGWEMGTAVVASATATVESEEARERSKPAPGIVIVLVLAWASLIAMAQLDRLVGDVVGDNRAVYRLSDVVGFTPWVADEAWKTWGSTGAEDALAFVGMHTAADFLFIACYTFLLWRLVSNLAGHAHVKTRRRYRALVWAIAGFDVVENVTILGITLALTADSPREIGFAVFAQSVFTGFKWLATIAFASFAVFGDVLGVGVRAFVKGLVAGLYAQRLGLIMVVGFAYLALSGNGDLAEQIPDVYRGWLDFLHPLDKLRHGVPHAIWATAGGVIVLGGLVYFGRQRGRRYLLGEPPTKPVALLTVWCVAAVLLVVLGFTLRPVVALASFLGLLIVLLAVPGVSGLIRRNFKRINSIKPLLRGDVERLAPAAFWAGDALAVTWVAAGLLAPLGAMMPVLALIPLGQFDQTGLDDHLDEVGLVCLGALLLAAGASALTWYVLRGPLEPLAKSDAADHVPRKSVTPDALGGEAPDRAVENQSEGEPAPTTAIPAAASETSRPTLRRLVARGWNDALVRTSPGTNKPWTLWLVEGFSAAACVFTVWWFATRPTQAGASVGPLAVVLLLLGAWIGIAGCVVLALGERRPPELFLLLRLRSTPVVAIAIVLPIVVGSMFPTPDPHAIRLSDDLTLPSERPKIDTALGEWTKTACVLDGPGAVHVQPLILVAAEGGGIRAATWTVDVLRELYEPVSDCAANAVFASAGASGGSVGLAMFATSTKTDKHDVVVSEASGPNALTADVAALLSGEAITALTGVRLPIEGANPDRPDRAALQESVWEADDAHQLDEPFDAVARPGTGYVVFNSTDSVSNCKVVISQLNLSASGSGSSQCGGPGATLAHSVDLIGHIEQTCVAGMTWATASFLSARFPFVSPSGRLAGGEIPKGCAAAWDMQLLDGGLLDNSALGTVSDMVPEVLAAIRARNNASGAGNFENPIIVPLVLWVSNGPGSDVLAASGRARPEWVAPIVTLMSAKGAQLEPVAWLSRLADQLDRRAVCGGFGSSCWAGVNAVQALIPTSVAVASQATQPATSVPLGWTLSWFSRSRLGDAAEAQGDCMDSSSTASAACRASGDYSSLGALIDVFSRLQHVKQPPQDSDGS